MHNLNIYLHNNNEIDGSGYTDSTATSSCFSITVENTIFRFNSKEEVLRFINNIRDDLNKINKELKTL